MREVDVARAVTGRAIDVVWSSPRAGDPSTLVADIAAIRDTFGWQPQKSAPRVIIEDAWRWRLAHPNGYA